MTPEAPHPSPEAADARRAGARPTRERVTSVDVAAPRTEPIARPARWEVDEAEALFTRTLMRAHGRLALLCLLTFAVALLVVTVGMSGLPQLQAMTVGGVPVSWLVHAYGFYPLMIGWAVAYAVASRRLERRFRQLVEHE